jgi:hypothetical protein
MGASTTVTLPNYHKAKWGRAGVGSAFLKVARIDAACLGPVTAAEAASGVSNVWEGVLTVPIASNDEIHYAWATPYDLDYRFPLYVRWGVIATADNKAATCLTTYDYLDAGDTAADGATALAETIPAKTPGINKVNMTYWGKTTPSTSDFDYLFLKMVATSCTTADNVKVWCLEIAYTPTGV